MLVEAGPEIFAMFKTHLRKYAQKALAERDVEVACGEVVESVTAIRVTLKSGRVIPAQTLVWGAGLQANPIAASLGLKVEKGNRIPTHHAGENIGRRLDGAKTEPFTYFDRGTMATIGRGAAVMQGPHGRTMKGKSVWLAWGGVHLALLSTGEDRAKAVIEWAWTVSTHERTARITVRTDRT